MQLQKQKEKVKKFLHRAAEQGTRTDRMQGGEAIGQEAERGVCRVCPLVAKQGV